MRAYERLLKYVVVPTASAFDSNTVPTTDCQLVLAKMLAAELDELGVIDAGVDENGYVYGHIPASPGFEAAKHIAFIAHMDTSPDFNGVGVKPVITENYDGGDLPLGTSGRALETKMFPHLPSLRGRTLITTDGTSLLGADDKAGIAEIMTAAQRLLAGEVAHGPVSICFTPDEEVGTGADHLDLARLGARFAYTVDGGAEGHIEYENFNAASAEFEINGVNIHPGNAKDTMVNASLVAMEINAMLPGCDVPARTEGYEGFYHLCSMSGSVESAYLEYIVRDHSEEMFNARKATLRHIEKTMNEKYGEGSVRLTLKEQYRNMVEMVRPEMHLIENARAAIRGVGLEPVTVAIRGGTDGARLSYMGLPCPNLGTGGYAFHGPYEHITAEGMDLCTDIIVGIAARYAAE